MLQLYQCRHQATVDEMQAQWLTYDEQKSR